MDGVVITTFGLTNSQVYPYGTYEQYNPSAVDSEGHFYMECSNQGLCNREVGDCVCFDGFEGSACQRASCPNACSNHGSCESISEFATTAGGTLFTKGLSSGNTEYDLWDAKVSYGCRCDPWFTGADCSQRLCKVGVDPMYYDTEQVTYDTIAIDGVAGVDDGHYIRIRFWDYWGESFITDRIVAGSSAGITIAQIEAAFEALPNGVISDLVQCETSATPTLLSVTVSGGTDVLCQFKSNPGALRLPEIYEQSVDNEVNIRGTPLRGEDENLCNTLFTSGTISSVNNDGTITLASASTTIATLPYLVKYNDQYAVVTGQAQDSDVLTLTLASAIVAESTAGLTADLYYSSTPLLPDANGKALNSPVVGVTTLILTGHGFAAGDKIICESQIFNVVTVTDVNTVEVDRPYFGTAIGRAADATTNCYEISSAALTTSYVSECAGRGICDRESGVCSCFKGYTNDNCDKQSILAF